MGGVLALKLLLTPTIVVLATLAGKRFGRIASGWLLALPLTSGPITIFLAVEHGRAFGARAATGSLSGAIGEAAFCVVYAFTARRRGWLASAASASVAFAAAAAVLRLTPIPQTFAPILLLAALAAASLLLGLKLVPSVAASVAEAELPSRWDLPLRAVVSTGFLLALTAAATALGPRLSGLVAVYPLYTVVVAAFAHAQAGESAAVDVLRGLLLGLYSFVSFYFVVAVLLPHAGIAGSFAAAFAAALVAQALSLRRIRTERRLVSPRTALQ